MHTLGRHIDGSPAFRHTVGAGVTGGYHSRRVYESELVIGPAFLPVPAHSVLDTLMGVVFAGAIGISILKYRLYDIDVLISRSVVYGTLTAAVVGVYLLVTWLGGTVLGWATALPGVVAAAVVAVGLTPARNRLQQAVDRLLYGERGDPLRAVSQLGDSVAETDEPSLLTAVLASVMQAVRASGVVVLAPNGRELAGVGTEVHSGESLPLETAPRPLPKRATLASAAHEGRSQLHTTSPPGSTPVRAGCPIHQVQHATQVALI